jgi:hypothetical protein
MLGIQNALVSNSPHNLVRPNVSQHHMAAVRLVIHVALLLAAKPGKVVVQLRVIALIQETSAAALMEHVLQVGIVVAQ